MKEYKTDEDKRTFYKSATWNDLRRRALERDNYECQECKRQGKVHADSKKVDGQRKKIELNVHHKYEIENYPKLALTFDNLSTICLYHHNLAHGRIFNRKPNKWEDDELEIL